MLMEANFKFFIAWQPEQIILFLMRRTETQSDLTIKSQFEHIICEVYHRLAL